MRSAGDVERAIAGLYGGALNDFIRSRDALAKELRSAGERAAASHVKSLRKPSRPAWALDRVATHAPERLSALEAAVAGLIDAHTGTGDVRAAMTTLRSAVRGCAAHAEREARSAGFGLDAGNLSNALLAVLGNPDAHEEFCAGRLVEIPDAGGLDFLTSLPARPKLEVSSTRSTSAEADPEVDATEVTAARERVRQTTLAVETARTAADTAASASNEAEAEVAAARDKVRAAESELKAAQQRHEFVRRKQEAAATELRQAEAAHNDARARLARLSK